MIPGGKHIALDYIPEPLQIDNKTSDRINVSGHRHLKRIVVPMSIAIGTPAKDLLVLLLGPGRVPVVVRS